MGKRPLYETPDDRANEYAIVRDFIALHGDRAKHWNIRKLSDKYTADYAVMKFRRVIALIEAKRRYYPITQFPDIMMGLKKWTELKAITACGVPCLLVFRFDDGIRYHRVTDEPWPVELRGRTDRDDAQDVEPMVMIPTKEWQEVTT